jgi:hypothetical protein
MYEIVRRRRACAFTSYPELIVIFLGRSAQRRQSNEREHGYQE